MSHDTVYQKYCSNKNTRIPWYSKNHPMIPQLYVQPWTQDMQNRSIIIHNARKGNVPTFEHDDALFLNKREQMTYNVQERNSVDQRTQLPPRPDMINTEFHSTTNRYFSNMISRLA